jgi:hypothetical protein
MNKQSRIEIYTCRCTDDYGCGHGNEICGKPLDAEEQARVKLTNDPKGTCPACIKALTKHSLGEIRRDDGSIQPPR